MRAWLSGISVWPETTCSTLAQGIRHFAIVVRMSRYLGYSMKVVEDSTYANSGFMLVCGLGEVMSQDVHLDCYRAALEAANAEMSEIVKEFDQLRLRKDRIQTMLEALKPVLGGDAQIPALAQRDADRSSAFIEQATAPSPEPVQENVQSAQYGFMEVAEKLSPRLQTPATSWSNLLHRPARVAIG